MSADERAVDAVARAWIEEGGDAEGIEYLWRAIRDRVAELLEGDDGE